MYMYDTCIKISGFHNLSSEFRIFDINMDSLGIDPENFTYYFEFEKTYDTNAFHTYMLKHYSDCLIYSFVYLLFVFGGPVYMRQRKAFELRPYLACWSGLLAVFSITGAIRTIPELFWSLTNHGLEHSCCSTSNLYPGTVTSFWTGIFTMSKVLELGDTVFIILRKQHLSFLHWYHHATVMIYVWYSYTEGIASGRWFVVMNYAVHSLMYSYFALRAMKYTFPKGVSVFITSLQLVQMVMGITVNLVAYKALSEGRQCGHNYTNIKYCLLMYFSYLVLFLHFFYTSYIVKKSHNKDKEQ